MNAIRELRQIGFEFWIDNGKIRYKQQSSDVNQNRIPFLLAEIKTHKDEAIRYLKGETKTINHTDLDSHLTTMYEAKLNSIAASYQLGGLDFLKANHPVVYTEILQAEDKLNQVWKSTLQGQATITDFEAALNTWYQAQLSGIALHKASVTPSMPPQKKVRRTIPIVPAAYV